MVDKIVSSDLEEDKSFESSVSSLFAPQLYREFKMSGVLEKSGILKESAANAKINYNQKSMFGVDFGH